MNKQQPKYKGTKHELELVQWNVIPDYNYHGTLVSKIFGGYRVFGQTCITPQEVDEIIQNACSILSESLVVRDSDNWICLNGVESQEALPDTENS